MVYHMRTTCVNGRSQTGRGQRGGSCRQASHGVSVYDVRVRWTADRHRQPGIKHSTEHWRHQLRGTGARAPPPWSLRMYTNLAIYIDTFMYLQWAVVD